MLFAFRRGGAGALLAGMPAPPPAKQENLLLNLACNVAAPALALSYLSKPGALGPKGALLVALAFPIGYGLWDFSRRRSFNFLSALGFAATLATGGLALLKLDPFWFAVKEAVVPALIGLVVVVSHAVGRPLVRSMLLNDQVLDVARVEAAITEQRQEAGLSRLLWRATGMLAGSFAFSAVTNFFLARLIVTAPAETEEFNAQLSRLMWWSWPVIAIPSLVIMMLALWQLLKGVARLTAIPLDDLFHAAAKRDAGGAR